MQIEKVCVIGGSGFVGRHLCQQLVAHGIRVIVPTRDRERAKALLLLPTVDVVEADAHHPAALAGVVAGCDAVINLVGVLHDGSGHHGFRAAHVELARNVVEACRAGGVKRLLQMSALGAATDAPSADVRSKAEADLKVLMGTATTGVIGNWKVSWPMRSYSAKPAKVIPAKEAYSIRQSNLSIKERK